jgi:hypothetical protein
MERSNKSQKIPLRFSSKVAFFSVRMNLYLFVVFSWSLFWRLFGANSESLHVDEHVQANGISPSLFETWAASRFLGMPPIDMTLQWIAVNLFGYSNTVIRSVPIILGALSCVVLTITVRNYSNKTFGVIAGLISGVIPQFVFTQQTVRPYSLYVLIVGLVFLFASNSWRTSYKPLIMVLTILPWTRSLEGPISAAFLTFVLFMVIFLKESTSKSKKLYFLILPSLSTLGSITWTSSTDVTILGPPGNALNNPEEIINKIQAIPELYLSDLLFMFGSTFTVVTLILGLWIAIFNLQNFNKHRLSNFLKAQDPIFSSFGFFTFVYLGNCIAIFIAVNALTKLPHADRYFTLGMLGLVTFFIYLLYRLNIRNNVRTKVLSTLIVSVLIAQYTVSTVGQAIRIDKTQYDQINQIIEKNPVEFNHRTIAYLPGQINQYVPGWPASVGLGEQAPPTWVTFLLRDVYSNEDYDLEALTKLDNIVLLPSVDQRGSLLIHEGWSKDLFDDILAPEKIDYLSGGAFVLRDLSKTEFAQTLEVVAKERFDKSESHFWIDALILTLSDQFGTKTNNDSRERFCSRLATGFQIDAGNTFGNWGQGVILGSTFFHPLAKRIC